MKNVLFINDFSIVHLDEIADMVLQSYDKNNPKHSLECELRKNDEYSLVIDWDNLPKAVESNKRTEIVKGVKFTIYEKTN